MKCVKLRMWEMSISEQETYVQTWSCRLGGFRDYEECGKTGTSWVGWGITNDEPREMGDKGRGQTGKECMPRRKGDLLFPVQTGKE